MLKEFDRIIIAFRGGGESKDLPNLTEEELFNRRKAESILVCSRYTDVKPEFLEVRRPVDQQVLKTKLKDVLEEGVIIVTTHKDDAHPEHKLLAETLCEMSEHVYGFIVNTKCLIEMLDREMPDKYLKLCEQQYKHKQESCTLYETQKHFLPNVVGRTQYKREYLWRM